MAMDPTIVWLLEQQRQAAIDVARYSAEIDEELRALESRVLTTV